MQELRNSPLCVLVRWTGVDAAGDTWEPLDNLTNCEAAIAVFERATGCSLPRPPPTLTCAAGAAPPIPPAGLPVEAGPPGDLGAALMGRTVIYWWPDDCWQRRTVARLCPRGAFSHVVAFIPQTSALRGTADTLRVAACYGSRWVLLSPAPAAGVARALRPRDPRQLPRLAAGRTSKRGELAILFRVPVLEPRRRAQRPRRPRAAAPVIAAFFAVLATVSGNYGNY